MNVLITGADGFVGRNLTESLNNIRNGKDRTHPEVQLDAIRCFNRNCSQEQLSDWCAEADFVFHLAGVNRPEDPAQFQTDNVDFSARLLEMLRRRQNRCPVMIASSIQASLEGRFAASPYGISKRAEENAAFAHAEQCGVKVLVYRFPNIFGKWCRPNYNSVVATFCHNIARDLPITIRDPSSELELLYIDDLVEEMILALTGREHHCRNEGVHAIPDETGPFCYVPVTHCVRLGELAELLACFRRQPDTLMVPGIPAGSFAKKLYSTYMSYLPADQMSVALRKHEDARGSFTELLRTETGGQFSVNVSRPGITKGEHWHHSKWEVFVVVSGHGLIRERRIGSDEVLEFEVDGEQPTAVYMLPGYTHNIINLSETAELVTLMWANECFDPEKPDTFRENVRPE